MHGCRVQPRANRRRRGAAAPTTCRPSSPPPGVAPHARPQGRTRGRRALYQPAWTRPPSRHGTSWTCCSAAGASSSSTRRTTPSSTTSGDTTRPTPRARRGCGSRSASTTSRRAGCATRRPGAADQAVIPNASTSCSDRGPTRGAWVPRPAGRASPAGAPRPDRPTATKSGELRPGGLRQPHEHTATSPADKAPEGQARVPPTYGRTSSP